MKEITKDTTIKELCKAKEFKKFGKYIPFPISLTKKIYPFTLETIQNNFMLPYDVDLNVKAMNTLLNKKRDHEEIFYLLKKDCFIIPYIIGDDRPFVLVIPGGGYGDVALMSEGFPIAQRINELGYNAFILRYRVGKEAHYPNPQDDVYSALSFIFENAEDWNVSTANYAVCGFSAGGHLAASWCTKNVGYLKYGFTKPKTCILAYPVISMDVKTHGDSRKMLLGEENINNKELIKAYSIDKQIDGDFPSTYCFQFKDDDIVPSDNTLLLKDALDKANVKNKCYLVEGTIHGCGTGKYTVADGWLDEAIDFWING